MSKFYEEAFEGYVVPNNLKETSKEICEEFNITGISDPMYIVNVIAKETGVGLGSEKDVGKVTDKTDLKVVTDRLRGSFGVNIKENERDKLYNIIVKNIG